MMPQTSTSRTAIALHHRKSVGRLTDRQLSDLREAYRAVLPIQDERGYNHHAGIHGLPLPIYCKHGDLLFLPWHRAYLYFFELALRDQVPDVSLPWWNWASRAAHASGIPRAYAAEQVGGQDNPLYSVPVPEIARQQGSRLLADEPPTETFRRPRQPADLPSAEDVEAALGAPNFVDFSNRMEGLHNWVHVWIGGTTAEVPWAAYDPLFWAHHAMVDRLWRVWQLRNPEANLDGGFLRQALPPFDMTVEDTLDVTGLGYEYASTTQAVGGTS
ncbi:MAG TPA: tyrosinase family protein [Rubrobacter sp.]|jgi:tyrosinase|nr:tyrosinase family protein [Rubrobacter sp.]